MTSPSGNPPPPPGFAEYLAEYLAETLDTGPGERAMSPAMEDWPAETARLVAAAGPGYWRRRQDRETRLAAELAAVAPLVTAESLPAFAVERLDIAAPPDFTSLGDSDLGYVKINHGLWEHIYWMFGAEDFERMRALDFSWLPARYVETGFLDGLATAIGRVTAPAGSALRFQGLHFGVSLASGTHDHPEVLRGFAARTPEQKRIVMGAAIGLTAWWQMLFPGLRPAFSDGSFPKRGLATGELRTTLAWAAARSDLVLFVVPPHLAAIRLADVSTPQETVLVPQKTIHESWAACLHATAGQILGRLAAHGRVLVITQSAVFSALLGLFLADAKRRLLPAASRLAYFDLGQVLDIATPEVGGHWVRTHAQGDSSLFRTDPA